MEYNLILADNKKILIIGLFGIFLSFALFGISAILFRPDKIVLLLMVGALILSNVFVFRIGYKTSNYSSKVKINSDQIFIDNMSFFINDIYSYNYQSSGIFDVLTIKLKDRKKIYLTIRSKSEQIKEYHSFINSIFKEIDKFNENTINQESQISTNNFYNSKFAKTIGYILIIALTVFNIWFFTHGNLKTTIIFKTVILDFMFLTIFLRIFVFNK